MGQKIASLEIELGMATGTAVAELNRFGGTVDAVSAQAIRDLDRIDASMKSVGGLDAATASAVKLAEQTARSAIQMARDAERSERAGERLVSQMERQIGIYGLTKAEVRSLRAEEAARAAENNNQGELAARIRAREADLYALEFAAARKAQQAADAAAEAAVIAADRAANAKEQEAQAVRSAASAHALFEARVREGAQAMREEEVAAQRDAATLASLRAMIDPAATAQNRLNVELAEARRVMTAAGASAQELAAAEDALWSRSVRATQQHDAMAGAARRSGGALQTIAVQLPDITQGLLTGQKPMTVFIQQGFQIVQVAQMGEGGLRGFGREVGALAIQFAPLLVGLAAAGAGLALFARWVNQGVTNEQLTGHLGKITGGADATKQELFKLKDATVSFGSTAEALFSVLGKDIASSFVGDMKSMGKDVKSVLDDMATYGRQTLAGMYAAVAGTRAYLGEVEKGGVVGLAKMLVGQGDPKLVERAYGAQYDVADRYLTSLGNRARKEAISIERQKLAEKIGFNNEPKAKVDRHAEQLEREAAATEAQIRNLYALADAYGVSGAAALIAEARVKAESDAIKKRGDIEAFVDRQVRLAIAERVKTSEQGSAAMRDQAGLQAEMNAMVADGLVPAERADALMQARLRELPLLQAIEAAQQRGLTVEAQRATKALEDQRDAQNRVDAAEVGKRFILADRTAERRLEELRVEATLIGATDIERVKALATIRATNEALAMGGVKGTPFFDDYVAKQVKIATGTEELAQAQRSWNDELAFTADRLDIIATNVANAGRGMADAFGDAGRAIGDMASIYADFHADRARLDLKHQQDLRAAGADRAAIERANQRFALATSTTQIGAYGDMAAAAKGFFKEGSDGYKAIAAAEKVYRVAQLAMSLQAMIQNAIETTTSVANAGARATAAGTAGIAEQAKLPFPANIAAMAATGAALIAAGIAVFGGLGGGGKNTLPESNTGTGTVLGDPSAQSESLRRGIDALKEVDVLMLNASRQMANSLRSIDNQIGGFAAQIVRSGNVDASGGVTEGFKTNAVGSVLKAIVPVFGGALASLFGTKTTVVGSGLYGGPQSVGSILDGGFDASTYSDVQKKKKLFGITTSTKYSTQYSDADAGLENQFTLILRGFASAIGAAAGPLGEATDAVQARLNGFVVNIGKIDLQGLTGAEIQEKLEAIFGAAADGMADAAFPSLQRFQKAGEGAFETLVRVASTVEAVTASFTMMGRSGIGIDASMALAGLFDSLSDLTSAQQGYFEAYYTDAEQAAARLAQVQNAVGSLGLKLPDTLAGFRALVEAQDLTSEAGRATYATLIQLAPAFADLQAAMGGAKSAADIAAERQDLERKLLELNGDEAAIRALDLAKLDASNRALQQQVWAAEAAKEAAAKAEELRKAWSSVGDSIMDEVKRIRGISDASGPAGFSAIMGQFNAVTAAARAGDMDAAKQLPTLSRSLLDAAAKAATSRQELDRVQAEAAASLEATYATIAGLGTDDAASGSSTRTAEAMAEAATAASTAVSATASLVAEVRQLREELVALRTENRDGHARTATEAGRSGKVLERATGAAGGDVIGTRAVA